MRQIPKWLLVTIVTTMLPQFVMAAELFRWVGKDGRVHYGDNVPPDLVKNGHVKLDTSGVIVEKQAAAKTDAEIYEENWLVDLEQRKQKKQEERERRDRHLLNTYTTLEELDIVYLKRLEQLETNDTQLEKLRDKYLQEVTDFKQKLAETTDELEQDQLKKFASISTKSLKVYQQALDQNGLEEKFIMADYLKDKQRLERLLNAEKAVEVDASSFLTKKR